jgi:glycine/D-amino acid oxidase-like deaminating enzyme
MSNSYIVVGQGLAGSALAYELLKQGHTVTVIDKDSGAGSSRVAAGIYHPLVFKRTTLTWKYEMLFDFLETYYPELEKELEGKFYHPMPYLRYFASQGERDNWVKFKDQDEYKSFLGDDVDDSPIGGVTPTFGVGYVKRSGWVDTNLLLELFRIYFIEKELLIEDNFDYNLIEFKEDKVAYKHLLADKIIFAEGYGITQNPYFSYLPLKATKGQVLTVEVNGLVEDSIINRKVFALPLGNNQFKVGSTYEWQWYHDEPTPELKLDLETKLAGLIDLPFKTLSHEAGVRPSVTDRRPFIGLHPQYPQLGVFNGMGSKGVMMAPYFAKQFSDWLIGLGELDKEADINRVNYEL